MRVTHKGKPGKVMTIGTYFQFIPDDRTKVKSLSIEPGYSLEILQNGLRITGFVRRRTSANTFHVETHDFVIEGLTIPAI